MTATIPAPTPLETFRPAAVRTYPAELFGADLKAVMWSEKLFGLARSASKDGARFAAGL